MDCQSNDEEGQPPAARQEGPTSAESTAESESMRILVEKARRLVSLELELAEMRRQLAENNLKITEAQLELAERRIQELEAENERLRTDRSSAERVIPQSEPPRP